MKKIGRSFTLTPDLYINGRFLTQQTTGVQAFAKSITEELAGDIPFRILVPERGIIRDMVCSDRIHPMGWFTGHAWEQISLPVFMHQHRKSVLLNWCNTGPVSLHNQVITLHDLAFIHNPSWFHPVFARYYRFLVPRLVNRCRKIITVSETMKQELTAHFNIRENKIGVIGNKVNPVLLSTDAVAPVDKRIVPRQFFLMVGSDDPRKNFSMAEAVFATAFRDITLVIAGGGQSSFRATERSPGGPNVIRLGYTPVSTLRWLYENALGLINPSLYEGFGIPNLEAFALGCPVICSRIPVFQEVCGDGAFYFAPGAADELTFQVQRVLDRDDEVPSKTLTGKAIFTSFQEKNRSRFLLNLLSE